MFRVLVGVSVAMILMIGVDLDSWRLGLFGGFFIYIFGVSVRMI